MRISVAHNTRQLLLLQVFFSFLIICTLSAANEPMDEVFSLLDSGGGTQTGRNAQDGYYVVTLAMSNADSEMEAFERARISALRELGEFINGVSVSSLTRIVQEHVSKTDNSNTVEFSNREFLNVVESSFKGRLSTVKVLKKGRYGGLYFVAMSVSEADSSRQASIGNRFSSEMNRSENYSTTKHTIAKFTDTGPKSVEAKGLASMKASESKAREQALQDALRNAVQQVQGVMLQGKSGMYNGALSMALSTKTEGYVRNYKILDEDVERGSYYVIIRAEVDSAKLLNDVNFYIGILGKPVFSVYSDTTVDTDWITDELESLGFAINNGKTKPTHVFSVTQKQKSVEDHRGRKGIETQLSLQLKDNETGDILLTVTNNPFKSRIYVKPESRAKQVSEAMAYKRLKKKLGKEVIQTLAARAKRGVVYNLVLKNAKRSDLEIFRNVFENGTGGAIEGWDWNEEGKMLTLRYRYAGTLSQAMDEGLSRLYSTYKQQGKGRQPHAEKITSRYANFKMVSK